MQDLSRLAVDAPWVTAQEGGNMTHDNSGALAGPGTVPVTPMPGVEKQLDPHVEPVSKPRSTVERGGGYSPSPLSWKTVSNG